MAESAKSVIDLVDKLAGDRSLLTTLANVLENGGRRMHEFVNENNVEKELKTIFLRPASSVAAGPTHSEISNTSSLASSYFTRSTIRPPQRLTQPTKKRRPTFKGPATFTKEVVLLGGPHNNVVVKHRTKQLLYESGHVMNAFEFHKDWSAEELLENIRSAFSSHLPPGANLEILMAYHNKLIAPSLMRNQTLNGWMMNKIFKQRSVYIRPSVEILDLQRLDQQPEDWDQTNVPDNSQDPNCIREETLVADEILGCSSEPVTSNPDGLHNAGIAFPNYLGLDSNDLHAVQDVCVSADSVLTQTPVSFGVEASKIHTTLFQSTSAMTLETNVLEKKGSDCYKQYTSLIYDCIELNSSSDEEGVQFAENSSVRLHDGDQVTLHDVITNLALQIDEDAVSKFHIDRINIWDGALRGFKRKTYKPENRMSVMFTDSDGNSEGAVDRGGPTREFLTLLMQTLQNSKIFEGSEDWKNLTCDSQALRDDDYFLAGRIIAISLVHGGPSPNFFSRTLYDSLAYDPQQVTPSVKDICDCDIAEIIWEMENVSTLEGLKDVAAKHCNLLHVAGCYRYLQNLQDRDVLVQDFMKWYVCGRTRNSLERLKEGLKTLGVLDAIVAHPVLFANSFCWREEVLTSEQFSELFKISFSTAGSNKRSEEQRIVGYWRDYLQDVEDADSSVSLRLLLCH
ncbi:uncharacterized protein LOC117407897 isoform X1 [Acipenser ruthenus]|uniref:uncharacterized protein LOC117407897 isoform X1 n=1 Tax=Acipenser ruthenus TaxID=7906 RepID=UPI002740C0D5|nr:uncharacterized protein LOC117407897 isoform X1 [Acipenser ruthenus]